MALGGILARLTVPIAGDPAGPYRTLGSVKCEAQRLPRAGAVPPGPG